MAADIAIVGLGVMGANLARNLHSRGLTVAVYNRSRGKLDAFVEAFGDDRFLPTDDLGELVASLKRPRKILLMVTAGAAVDAVIAALAPHLDEDDIVVDGGNSHFPDTDRRSEDDRFRFVGMGVSGGEEGALLGPSMMPGGDREAVDALLPLLKPAAAKSHHGPCITWCGRGSAGHYVKMVHNGIEYGDMQLIAEVWTLLREGLGRSPSETREVFQRWNDGRLQSYLVEITSEIVAAKDPVTGDPLIDQVLDVAGQKGTGRWTVLSAVDQGVPTSTITAAVDARALSARKALREQGEATFGRGGGAVNLTEDELEQALYAAKIMSYTQGFELIRAASEERDYGTDLAAVARIWTAGCIIRARFLDRITEAYEADPDLPLLALHDTFATELRDALPAWREVVSAAVTAGIPVPGLATSLAWFDTLRRGRGSAAMIQAQRDYFGAHTYRRVDDPDTPVHTDWDKADQL